MPPGPSEGNKHTCTRSDDVPQTLYGQHRRQQSTLKLENNTDVSSPHAHTCSVSQKIPPPEIF